MPVQILWDPVSDVLTCHETLVHLTDEVSGRACQRKTRRETPWTPAADIYETDTDVILHIELAGIDKNSLHIVFEHGQLFLWGKRAFEKSTHPVKIHRMERMYGTFQRIFRIPALIKTQAITASYERGILQIVLPKQHSRNAEPINIPITCTQE